MDKYPRTPHFPFSPEVHKDDKVIKSEYLDNFIKNEIGIFEKIDGGNSCWKGRNGVFARSHAMPTRDPWFNYMKREYYERIPDINPDLWLFLENTYAIHTIEYTNMKSYAYMFAAYDSKRKIWLSWDNVKKEADRLDIPTVPLIYRGTIGFIERLEHFLKHLMLNPSELGGEIEGFVVRNLNSFSVDDFGKNVAKYVRKGHVQTDEHWTEHWKPQRLVKGD